MKLIPEVLILPKTSKWAMDGTELCLDPVEASYLLSMKVVVTRKGKMYPTAVNSKNDIKSFDRILDKIVGAFDLL